MPYFSEHGSYPDGCFCPLNIGLVINMLIICADSCIKDVEWESLNKLIIVSIIFIEHLSQYRLLRSPGETCFREQENVGEMPDMSLWYGVRRYH